MATERLPMNKTGEILRLRWQIGLSVRQVATSLGVSVGVVSKTAARTKKAGLKWADVDPSLADAILDRLVDNAYKLDLKGNSRRREKTATQS